MEESSKTTSETDNVGWWNLNYKKNVKQVKEKKKNEKKQGELVFANIFYIKSSLSNIILPMYSI